MTHIKSSAQRNAEQHRAAAEKRKEDKKTYAVVDDFKNKTIDIDGDGKFDLSHGEYVTSLMKANNPDIKVKTYNIANLKTDENVKGVNQQKLLNAFNQIADENYAGVNLSFGQDATFSQISSALGVDNLDKDNYFSKKDEIKNKLETHNPGYKGLFDAMEKITANGTPLYVSASNHGHEDKTNLWALADGVKVVGMNNSYTQFGVSNGVEATIFDQGAYKSKAVVDKNGKVIGYDINDDGKADIANSKVSGGGKLKNSLYEIGTSFSTPNKLVKDTKAKQQQESKVRKGIVYKSTKQTAQEKFEQEYNNQNNKKVKNKDLDDGIKIDDNIDEWDKL